VSPAYAKQTFDVVYHFYCNRLRYFGNDCAKCLENTTLSCRRGTARRCQSVEVLSVVAQLYEKSHLKTPAICEWRCKLLNQIWSKDIR